MSQNTKQKMEAAIEHLKSELNSIRTGKASPAILDSVSVEVYGSPMRLKDISSITTPEARMILITPFDASNTAAIAKAIEKSNLGLRPIAEGKVVRIKIAAPDKEEREKNKKLAKKRAEEGKVSIRNVRREANDALKELAEDERKRQEKGIQELTDKYCKIIDELCEKKEQELSEM
jgi:ribosome recycling factor